ETPELKQAKQEIRRLNGALDILSKPFPGHQILTPKERVALAQIIRGASSKEAGRTLGISPLPSISIAPISRKSSVPGTSLISCIKFSANNASQLPASQPLQC